MVVRLNPKFKRPEGLFPVLPTHEAPVQRPKEAGTVDPFAAAQTEMPLVPYKTAECATQLSLDAGNDTVWATQQQMADLFGVDRSVIGKHLSNIFGENELSEKSVCAKFARTGSDRKTYQVQHYSLDAILSVGYRVSSKKATEFRKWANQVLKSYLVTGYALNESKLRNDPQALRELAAKVREMRANEANIYQAVRDVFALGADYDPSSSTARSFFAFIQDKFLYAVTDQTACQIIIDRADADEAFMGVKSMKGEAVAKTDIHTGKNYLDREELYALHILCEQFLLFVESKAIRGVRLRMDELASKFDELLAVQGHTVFRGYDGPYLKDRAKAHAETEFKSYRKRLSISPPGTV